MTVDAVYSIMKYSIAKNTQSGYLSPSDFNLIVSTAQSQYLDYLLGEFQKYQPTRPVAPVTFGSTEKLRQSLAPLIYGTVLTINSTTGISPFPSDFEQVDAMWSLYGIYNIRFTQQDVVSSWYRSSIDPIQSNPVYLIQSEGFHFYPENLGFARMSYVRKPPPITWAYTLDGNGLPVYDPINSQQPVWNDADMYQIIARALRQVGVSLQVNDVINYATEIKNIGN